MMGRMARGRGGLPAPGNEAVRPSSNGRTAGRPAHEPLVVQFDASVTPQEVGLGVLLRRGDGAVLSIHQRREKQMTCNEAEYAALIWALELLAPFPPPVAWFISDSEVVVGQMRGRCDVNSSALRQQHRRACQLLAGIPEALFIHVPRELNVLADAASREALWQAPPWRAAYRGASPRWGPTCSTS